MSAREFNRRELARVGRWVALLVAVYAAGWLLLSYRAARIGTAECRVVRHSLYECALEHPLGGSPGRRRWQGCTTGPWVERARAMPAPPGEKWPAGVTMPCFYYVNEPTNVFLEPRVHRWAHPLPFALLAAGLLGGAFGPALSRSARRPKPHEASPDAGPYRRTTAGPSRLAPLMLTLGERGWGWLLALPLLSPGVIALLLALVRAWTKGDEVGLFFASWVVVGHAALLLAGRALFFTRGLELLPDEGLLVSLDRVGPFGLRRAHELGELGEASPHVERYRRGASHYVVINRPEGKAPLRWGAEGEAAARRHAAAINAFLAEWRKG